MWLSRSEEHSGPKQVLKIKGDVAFRERIKMLAKIKKKELNKGTTGWRFQNIRRQWTLEPEEPPCGFLCRGDLKWWDTDSFPHAELSPEPKTQHHVGHMCSVDATSVNEGVRQMEGPLPSQAASSTGIQNLLVFSHFAVPCKFT